MRLIGPIDHAPGRRIEIIFNVDTRSNILYNAHMDSKDISKGGGRPPKFQEPRHPVTMTLPDRILDQLAQIDPDRTRAVVKVTEAVSGSGEGTFKPVELVEMAPGQSLIVVGPSQALRKITWLTIIEITPARYLLAIPPGTPIEVFEVALRDLLNDASLKENDRESSIITELLNVIGHQRRSRRMSKAEILIIGTS
jgi:hypothetical protein